MTEYFFGLGSGWLPKKAEIIARKHDAHLVNHTDDPCKCGKGCKTGTCEASRRHWFACENLGSPFNEATAAIVARDLKAAKLLE